MLMWEEGSHKKPLTPVVRRKGQAGMVSAFPFPASIVAFLVQVKG
jgi:hypothetical protein